MDTLYSYGPGTPVLLSDYISMMKNYASSRGISLDAHSATAVASYLAYDFGSLCNNIIQGIAHNAPVALLIGPGSEIYDSYTDSSIVVSGTSDTRVQGSFQSHWVTITAYNFAYDDTTLATVSSWGEPYILNLSAAIDQRNFLNAVWFTSGSYSSSDPTQVTQYVPYPGYYIQYGSTGSDVVKVQNRLNQLGFNCGTADGIFGNMTKNAVISFQGSRGLVQDGIVGPTTWDYLFNR